MSTVKSTSSLHEAPYERPAQQVLADLGADAVTGLTSAEVRERQRLYGANILRATTPTPAWQRFVAQFHDPQVYLLLAAAALSLVVFWLEHTGGIPFESLIILAIVLLNAALGFFQEDRAERALASLRKMAPAEATAIRDGEQRRLLAEELVPGDVLVLHEGDVIAADTRLLQARSLHTSEASLTGESLPVLKMTEPVAHSAAIGDRVNMVFAGTMVISGNGRGVVTDTGPRTEFGKIAEMLQTAEEQTTPLQQQLKQLSKQLGIAVVVIATVVVITLLALQRGHEAHAGMEILLFGIALAVAATPEGLTAIITLVLALGVQRMARRGAIVRKLAAVETLGSTTVIASDKTGTLTRNEMTVQVLMTASGRTDISGSGYAPEGDLSNSQASGLGDGHLDEVQALLLGAVLVNNAQLSKVEDRWQILGDPTEAALLTAARKAKILPQDAQKAYPRVGEITFSSERKMMSTLHTKMEAAEDRSLFTKGAPDILLQRCTHEYVAGATRILTEERRLEIERENEALTSRALRTLGVATRRLASDEAYVTDATEPHRLEVGLTFLGLVGMMDPPRPEARAAIEVARAAGIRTLLITGDHPHTAIAIAHSLNITSNDRVLSGAELDRISESDLAEAVRDTSVYARVNPEHKLRIVRALQQNNEIVAMTGDGVNDAPALKAAHIGIAMGITGTDVSKQAADLILTDDNFATIVAAVEEGRIVFDNIRKCLRYLLATNLGEVLIMFLSAVILSLRETSTAATFVLPLTAAQILWINLVTDGAPALALGVDSAASGIMRRRPRPSGEKLINYGMARSLAVVGIVMTAGTLWMFLIPSSSSSMAHNRSLAFTTLILFQLFNSLNARSDVDSFFRGIFSNRWLWAAILGSLALQYFLLNTSVSRLIFGVVKLSGSEWLLAAGVASCVLWVTEIKKYLVRHSTRTSGIAG